jgi:hydrogenase maturation protease
MKDPVRAIADAVLYEGYLLWPYRRSSLKNSGRWTFGGVHPQAWSEQHPDDAWQMHTECVLQLGGANARLDVQVRFLHEVARQVMARRDDGSLVPVDELTVDGERHLTWSEATEREVVVAGLDVAALAAGEDHVVEISIAAGHEGEPLGCKAGALVHSWEPLEGTVSVGAKRLGESLARVRVTLSNTTPWEGAERAHVVRRSFAAGHAVLHATGGEFVSLTDPPEALRAEAQACHNIGVWPVLVGSEDERHTLLASPIILEDHHRIAPESQGDLFDGGEIDGLLSLQILALTDAEKAEMRDTDPRAREILERTEGLTGAQLMRMHGYEPLPAGPRGGERAAFHAPAGSPPRGGAS